jgi:hypothetical protein
VAEAGVVAGSDDGGAEDDGGVEDGGAEDGGADEGGAEDDGGLDEDGADLVGVADPDPEPAGWPGAELVGAELIGVGASDVLALAGLRNALGDTDFEGDALGPADGPDPRAGAVAGLPAAACGWPCLSVGVWFAPIRANAATADPITTPPVRPAEASGREIR